MSPQKLFFCYHLPTRGRAGVKLGDAWYVSNVSRIFDASCLFTRHLLCVLLYFVAFLCIFWNYPTNEMPQCQFPVFCYFCVLEKLHRKYSRNWTKQKPNLLFFLKGHEVRRWDGGGPEAKLTLGWRGLPLARATKGWGQLAHLLTLPFRLYIPLDGKNQKDRSLFLETYCKPSPSLSQDRRIQEFFPAPCRRPSPPPWSPPEWCVSSLPWTTGQ
jgi:hypothetical protein